MRPLFSVLVLTLVAAVGCGDNGDDPRVDADGNLVVPGEGEGAGAGDVPDGLGGDRDGLGGPGEAAEGGAEGIGEQGDELGDEVGEGGEGDEESEAPECQVDLECDGGSICIENKCVDPGATEVPEGAEVGDELGDEVGDEVGEGGDDPCLLHADCFADEFCNLDTGKCEEGCRDDEGCAQGEICIDHVCAPAPCERDADCGGDEFCDRRDGGCYPAECFVDDDCDGGGTCALPAHRCQAPPGACAPDGMEPNDGLANAQLVGPGEFADLRLCTGEEDWYAVDLQVGEILQAHVEYDADAGDLDLIVLTSDNLPLGFADREGGIASVEILAEESDLVRLAVTSPHNVDLEYRLFVNVTPADGGGPDDPDDPDDPDPVDPPGCDNEDGLEDNDAGELAAEIAPGQFADLFICSADDDWYAVRAEAGDTLIVGIEFSHQAGDLDLFVYGPGGAAQLGRSAGILDVERVEAQVLDSGLQLIHVSGFQGAEGAYTLNVEVIGAGDDPDGPPACEQEDGLEDNDELGSATPIGAGQFADLFACAGDADWYGVQVCAGGTLTGTIRFAHGDGDLDLRVHGPGGGVLAISEGIEDDESVEVVADQAGLYALEVFGFLDAANAYALEVGVAGCDEQIRDDAFEDNDSAEEAAPIVEGLLDDLIAVQGDADWFTVPVCAGGTLSVDLVYDDADGGNVELQLVGAGGEVLATDAGDAGTASVQAGAVGAGALSIRVRATQGDAVSYALDVEVGECGQGPRDDGFEDNDTPETAADLLPGIHDGLVVTAGDDDWYAVDVCAGGVLTASLAFTHADGDLDMTIVAPAPGDGVLATSLSVTDDEEASVVAQMAGAYRIRVYGWQGAANGYALTVAVDEAGCEVELRDDPLEDNDDAGSASPIEPGVLEGLVVLEGDDDWFSIDACAGATISATITFIHADGDVDMTLQSPEGVVLGSAVSVTDNEALQAGTAVAGSYLLRVYGFRGAQNTYTLTVAVDEAGCEQQPPDDALEDNDTPQTATVLGIGPLAGEVEHGDLVAAGDDEDYYSLQACSGAVVTARIHFAHAEGDLQLSLLNGAGVVLASSVSETDDEGVSYVVNMAGGYTLRVWSADPAGQDTPYRLVVEVDDDDCGGGGGEGGEGGEGPGDDDDWEENDTQDTAVELLLPIADPADLEDLVILPGDDDWYAVQVCAGGALSAAISFVDADGDLDMAIHAADGTLLDSSTGVLDEESVDATPLEASTLFIRVYGWQGAANTYSMVVDLDDAACPDLDAGDDDVFEDNDTQETAAAIPAGDYDDLLITEADDDWFAVELCEDGVITATITFANIDGDLDLSLVDIDGSVVDFSDGVGDSEEVTATANVDTTAYIRVFGWRGAANAYSLSVVIEGC